MRRAEDQPARQMFSKCKKHREICDVINRLENKQVKMRENQIKKLGNYHFVGKTLGKGHFGFVELAVHTLTNIKVLVFGQLA